MSRPALNLRGGGHPAAVSSPAIHEDVVTHPDPPQVMGSTAGKYSESLHCHLFPNLRRLFSLGFIVLIVCLCLIIIACCTAAYYLFRTRRTSSGRRTAPASTSQYQYSSTTSEPKPTWRTRLPAIPLPFLGRGTRKEGWVQANSGDDWDTRSLHEEAHSLSTDQPFVPPTRHSPYTPPNNDPLEHVDGKTKRPAPHVHYSSADSYRGRSGSFNTLDLYAPGGPLSGNVPNLRDSSSSGDLITDQPRSHSPTPLHIDPQETEQERRRREGRTLSAQSGVATFSGGTKFIEGL